MSAESLQQKGGAWATGASVLAAIASSACCWLPLSLLALGISGGTIAATFHQWRTVFLPITFALLGMAFYLTYRKPNMAVRGLNDSSSPDGASCCSVPVQQEGMGDCRPPQGTSRFTLKKLNKGMLWVAAVVVLAFAFFPSYVGALLGGPSVSEVNNSATQEIVLGIDGMTCAGCEVTLERTLAQVSGVERALVSYEEKRAVITVDSASAATATALVDAVEHAGFRASVSNSK